MPLRGSSVERAIGGAGHHSRLFPPSRHPQGLHIGKGDSMARYKVVLLVAAGLLLGVSGDETLRSIWSNDVSVSHGESTLRIIKSQEGFRGMPYPDGGGRSLGYGTHLPLVEPEGDLLMKFRLKQVENGLRKSWKPYDSQNEHVKQALCLMGYELGVHGVLEFRKTLQLLADGQNEAAVKEAINSAWGKEVPARAKMVTTLFVK